MARERKQFLVKQLLTNILLGILCSSRKVKLTLNFQFSPMLGLFAFSDTCIIPTDIEIWHLKLTNKFIQNKHGKICFLGPVKISAISKHRPVLPGCVGSAMAHPDFGRSVNLFSTKAQCFHLEVKVAVLDAISQNYNFFEVKLVPYASLCLGNYLDQFFVKF